MMAKGSRILVLVGSLALGLVYVLPLWRISLEAPQYPEGLGMVIRVNTIEGVKTHDLANINNLNHYIGMRPIVPESIPELKIMPAAVGVLIFLGIVAAAVGRPKLLYGFVALYLTFALVGLVDFWKWEYDYGHNLDEENAIIKVPGMSYQPPLIGSRQILNFRAHSWPASGGWVLIGTGAVFTLVAFVELRRSRRRLETARGSAADVRTAGGAPAVLAGLAVASLLGAAACSGPAPRPIVYGGDTCELCHMGLVDPGHGTELVTNTGRTYVFDSIECLAAYVNGVADSSAIHSLWVTDFSDPAELILVEDAFFVVSQTLQSPMGLGLTAFEREQDRDEAIVAASGEPLGWAGVRDLVAARWPEGSPRRGASHGIEMGAGHPPDSDVAGVRSGHVPTGRR